MRRLNVLIRALPPEAILWAVLREAEEAEIKELTSVERIRARAEHYRKQAEEAE